MKAIEFINFINQEIKKISFANHEAETRKIFEHIAKLTFNQSLLNQKSFNINEVEKIISKRKTGMPLSYIIGYEYFFGYKFFVNNYVLIPRPDSEILVYNAILNCKGAEKMVDFGSGSGCLGISIAKNVKLSNLILVDISTEALDISAKNAENLQVKADFLCHNILDIEKNIKIIENCDVLISNPPYIDKQTFDALEPQVKNFEPQQALTDGGNGLAFYKVIVNSILLCNNKPRLILLEMGFNQAEDIIGMLKPLNSYNYQVIKDLAGRNRVLILNKI